MSPTLFRRFPGLVLAVDQNKIEVLPDQATGRLERLPVV